MSGINRQLYTVLSAVAAVVAVVYLLWPQHEQRSVFAQLSPGFIHNRYVTDATTLLVKSGSTLQQRIWIPTSHISQIDMAVDCPVNGSGEAVLNVYGDEGGAAAALIGQSRALPVAAGEICSLNFMTPWLEDSRSRWIWAEVGPADADPIVVFREQSVDHYPGGDLILMPAGKHVISVLAFTLWQTTDTWQLSGVRVVVIISLLGLFIWSMMKEPNVA